MAIEPKPLIATEPLNIRVPQDVLEQLDAYCKFLGGATDRTYVIACRRDRDRGDRRTHVMRQLSHHELRSRLQRVTHTPCHQERRSNGEIAGGTAFFRGGKIRNPRVSSSAPCPLRWLERAYGYTRESARCTAGTVAE